MLRKLLAFFALAGLLALSATPALANHIELASINLACNQYTINVSANFLATGAQYSIPYTFTISPNNGGPPLTIMDSISFTADQSRSFADSVTKPLSLTQNFTASSGSVSLVLKNQTQSSLDIFFSPLKVNCPPPPPPPPPR